MFSFEDGACYCDYDSPDFFRQQTRRARKHHVCRECGHRIAPGDTYEYTIGKWAGYVDSFKTCDLCLDFRRWMGLQFTCFCWAYGNLHDDIREHFNEVGHLVLSEAPGVYFEAGRRYVNIRRRARASRQAAAHGQTHQAAL